MMRRRVGPWAVAALVLLPVVASDVAVAHELGADRFAAPIPLPALFVGAGATVAATALWLGYGRTSIPRTDREVWTLPPAVASGFASAARVGFALVLAFVVVRGLVGRQVTAENWATLFVWPVWVKGLGLLAVLVGSPWRVLSPWRAGQAALERLEGSDIRLRPYPDSMGVWPAVVGFVVIIGLVENLTVVPRSPRQTAGLVSVYAALMLGGGLLFGNTWFARGDLLEVLYRQFARVSPVEYRAVEETGAVRLSLRYPWQGCLDGAAAPGAVTFVVAMVYTVTFDGFTNTPEYQSLQFALAELLGLDPTGAGITVYLAGLLGFVTSFLATATFVDRVGRRRADPLGAACAFAPTVVPIAAAYEVAHNYPYVLQNLARLTELVLSAGGAVDPAVSFLGWLSVQWFWACQVVLIVLGHVVAVVAAHGVALDRYETPSRARRAHLPLVVVMVGYTVLSLWVISRPVVAG